MRDTILNSRGRFWSPQDLDLPRPQALRLLRALQGQRELRRVRPGLYWRGHMTRFGMTAPAESALLDALLPGVVRGPCGPSAANQLGLSTQVPGRSFVAACARPVRAGRVIVLRDRRARTGRQQAGLTAGEVAVLEVLGDDRWCELSREQVDTRIAGWVAAGHVRRNALEAAAGTEPARVRRRLAELIG